jgi:Fe-S cluster biogenesis protein NfuA
MRRRFLGLWNKRSCDLWSARAGVRGAWRIDGGVLTGGTFNVHSAEGETIPAVEAYHQHGRRFISFAATSRVGDSFSSTPRTQAPCNTPVVQKAINQRRWMFIQTQATPNPTSLMFLPGKPVMEGGSRNFANAREGMASPLAKRLFQIDGISQVFFGSDFITVTKTDAYSWSILKPDVFAAITEFYSAGDPVLYENSGDPASAAHTINEDDDEVVAMIKELLETRIRPAVQEDGGDISYQGFDHDSGVVMLKMMGACSGCPSSAVTLKSGIENMLMHYIPEVKGVMEAPPDDGEQEGLKAFNRLEQHLSA